MPLYSAGAVRLQSGDATSTTTMQPVQRVISVRIDENVPRSNVMVLNRGKPLEQRPVINYTPVAASVDFYEVDSQVRQMFGLVNASNVTTNITDTRAGTATYGVRNMHVLFAPTSSANYNGEIDLKSGVLQSFSLQGAVGDFVRGNFVLDFLDRSGSINTTARDSTNVAAALVKPEGQALTGIPFTGIGLTGITLQSFSFNLGLSRTAVQQLGTK